MNSLLWILSLGFVPTSSLDRIHIRRGDVLKKNHDSSRVTRWCQTSRWAPYKNGNIALACSFCFWHKSSINRCSTQRKWNDLKPIYICKYSNTVVEPTYNLPAIEQADSKGDLSNIVKILASRSSRGCLPVRISSWRSWRPNRTSAIQNQIVRSL
jgi:hypothetical protein